MTSNSPASENILQSYSWRAISDTVAIKILDKSAFLHHGSGVPRGFKAFFGLNDFSPAEQRPIKLIHKGQSFDAHFQMDTLLMRMRLFWRSDFAELIKELLPDWYKAFSEDIQLDADRPEMRFQRVNADEYQIDFIIPELIDLDIESEVDDEPIARSEGAIRYSYSKRHERDPVNRRIAIETHGCICSICGFDFEAVYGERGKGFIEVHHTVPLGQFDEEISVDPKTDLIPVCANCHRMIHRRNDNVLSVSKMKGLLFKVHPINAYLVR